MNQLVFVAGSGHSGSTLLNLLLGSHEQISAIGEAHRLYLSANKDGIPHLCACGRRVLECPFWMRVAEQLGLRLGSQDPELLRNFVTTNPRYLAYEQAGSYLKTEPLENLYPLGANRVAMLLGSRVLVRLLAHVSADVRLHWQIIRNSLLLFDAVREAWNTPVIVDSTKNAARMKGLYLATKVPFHIIYLVRDGRAVCASRMRREGLSMRDCARIWKAEHRKLRVTMLTIPGSRVLRMRYEDLCRDAPAELLRVCERLRLPFSESMLASRKENHGIGGNVMRLNGSRQAIRLDERWRYEVGPADLSEFERVAGSLNQRFGYPD